MSTVTFQSLASSLQPFYGKEGENFKAFLKQFELLAKLEKWEEERAIGILLLNLKDKAYEFITSDPVSQTCKKLNDYIEKLSEKYEIKKSFEEKKIEFDNITQKPGQSIQQLADLISVKAQDFLNPTNSNERQIHTLTENSKMSQFLRALRPDIKKEVLKLGPRDFSDAIKHAKNVQNAFKQVGEENPPQNFELNNLIKIQKETTETLNKLSENLNKIQNSQPNVTSTSTNAVNNVVSKNPQCHICFRFGHWTTECWYYPKQTNFQVPNQNFGNSVKPRKFLGKPSKFQGRPFQKQMSNNRGARGGNSKDNRKYNPYKNKNHGKDLDREKHLN